VRDAAARAECQNNLKQICLATINTADANKGVFPTATIANPSLPIDQRLSWIVSILANMDQKPLADQIDWKLSWSDEKNRPVTNQRAWALVCPAEAFGGSNEAGNRTTYVGIAGVGVDAANYPSDDRLCGAFGHERRTYYPASFTDGTSQTMLVADTGVKLGEWACGGSATVRGLDPEDSPYISEDGPFGRVHRERRRFASIQATLQVALGDGSVRTVSSKISDRTFEAAATIAGGETLGDDW
jgi:hypothetical protein